MKFIAGIIALSAVVGITLQAVKVSPTAYVATDLVSDQPGVAQVLDPNLVNGWGIALPPTGGAFWVSSEGAGLSTLYTGDVNGSPLVKVALVVSIPGEHPTGQVFNPSMTDFLVSSGGVSGVARFIFASTSGMVSGWNPAVSMTSAQAAFTATDSAIYTGIALANNGTGNFLYLADFHNRKIDVLDGTFHLTSLAGAFSDPDLPTDYAPFNVAALGGKLYVAYAKQDATGEEEVAGAHLGFVDVFDLNGAFLQRLVSEGNLNAPWAMVIAPLDFGDFSGDLLVGNFGDGRINAYDVGSGAFLGTLSQSPNQPIEIDGLWGLAFGNGVTAGSRSTLYYAAGPHDETHGLFDKIAANAAGTSPVAATITNGTLLVSGSRNADDIDVDLDADGQQIIILADKAQVGAFDLASIARIQVIGFDGDDDIKIDKRIVTPSTVDGGAGNDKISGGGGNNILLGGPGDDILLGSAERDVLIGGDGHDRLRGDSGDDLLIAGLTAYDNNTSALLQILAEWTSTDSYVSRIALLHSGSGAPKLDLTTVIDDGIADLLNGDQGLDWFFAGSNDVLHDRTAAEQVN
jgi:uncharacterized protein (TIGR03118 family)